MGDNWGDGHRSFLLAERARSECARSMRAVKDQAAMSPIDVSPSQVHLTAPSLSEGRRREGDYRRIIASLS